MPVYGSDLINTSAAGQPADNEDRPFSFAMGTQIFINPVNTPTNAIVTFKLDAALITSTIASGLSNVALGLATDSELNSLSNWTEYYISAASPNRFAVGFGRLSTSTEKISVNISGVSVFTLARPQTVTSVSDSSNSLVITSHPYNLGDRVRVNSTGLIPGGLSLTTNYYVISDGLNGIKLATSRANAVLGSEVDIQTAGTGTITVASDEDLILTRNGSTGDVTLQREATTVATFVQKNLRSPLRLFYWNREQSASNTLPVLKNIKVRGAI